MAPLRRRHNQPVSLSAESSPSGVELLLSLALLGLLVSELSLERFVFAFQRCALAFELGDFAFQSTQIIGHDQHTL